MGGMPAFDLVLHTAAVLDAGMQELRSTRAGRQHFWPNGQAALWRKVGLTNVTETPIVIDCEYRSFADYWATFTGGQGLISARLLALQRLQASGRADSLGHQFGEFHVALQLQP